MMEGEIKAYTSTLTWDEIVYVLMKKVNREIALECSEYLLSLPNLQCIDVTHETLTYAHSIMEQHNMKPRDVIHTACLYVHGIPTIISEDAHFDKISSVNRIWMKEFA